MSNIEPADIEPGLKQALTRMTFRPIGLDPSDVTAA